MRIPLLASTPRGPHAKRARSARVLLATTSIVALATVGCGAKTGLLEPDVALPDASDVVDVPPPDVYVPPPLCIEPHPEDMTPLVVDLSTTAQISTADVLFVLDRTGSMEGEISNIRDNLRSVIVPGLAHAIPDLNLGLVTYGDFPITPYGGAVDIPFTMEHRMDTQFATLQGVLGQVHASGGGDNPEALTESLYQIATGEGLGRFIPRAAGCPNLGVGYACFRARAEPIVIVITDAPMHNGPHVGRPNPDDSHNYDTALFPPGEPVPHGYDQMLSAVREQLHAKVIGINSGAAPFWGRDDLRDLARDTGTLGRDGQPLVFDIGQDGSGLGQQVVTAVTQFTQEVRFDDVSARAVDIDGSGGARLVLGIVPQSASPMSQVQRMDGTTFYGVLPGTHLSFGLQLDQAHIVRGSQARRMTVRIEFLADGRPTLGFQDVEIYIPAATEHCPDAGTMH